MIKLAVIPDSPLARVALARLHEASISAIITTEWPLLGEAGPPAAILWISDRKDCTRAVEILRDLHRSLAIVSSSRCPACRYDLRGHEGQTRCPECGSEVRVVPEADSSSLSDDRVTFADVPCPHCGEPVPATFAICWNCQRPLDGP